MADTSLVGAGSGSWALVKEVWAEVEDVLPSRSERLAQGINVSTRPARVRMRYRDGVSSDMRLVLLRKQAGGYVREREMEIVAGPAILGNRDGLEFMCEDFNTAGNAA